MLLVRQGAVCHGPDVRLGTIELPLLRSPAGGAARLHLLDGIAEDLTKRQVATTFVRRGSDPAKETQSEIFTLEGYTFKASLVDRKFSYGRLTQRIERVRNYTDGQRLQMTYAKVAGGEATAAARTSASKPVDCGRALDQGTDRAAP